VGNVLIQHDGQVFPCVDERVISGYFARAVGEQRKFPTFEAALENAREALLHQTRLDAESAGANVMTLDCQI